MRLADLPHALPPVVPAQPAFPRRLLGAFRRKSITFCTGVTDEATVVYWFQSRSFTLDLRLPDGAATSVSDRQGWVGDTLWDEERQQMSWSIARSYQPRNQWPEPAELRFMGNSVLEFAPSGAYVEDWRQQSFRGPLLGLRLLSLHDEDMGQDLPMDGGLIIAGNHVAYAQSRLPRLDAALRNAAGLGQALTDRLLTPEEIESYEVSVALDGRTITHSTQGGRVGRQIASGTFALQPDGSVLLSRRVGGRRCRLRFAIDIHLPDFTFDRQTEGASRTAEWMEKERSHLFRHAAIAS